MNLKLSLYWTQVATVLSGAFAAQILPFMAAPLITRMCSPAQMGTFSVWLSVISIGAVGATLRLDTAMILDSDPDEQRICFSIVAYASTVLALLMTFGGLLARTLDLAHASQIAFSGWITIGIGIWLTAYMQVILAYATSCNAFGAAAKAKICGTSTIVLTQLALLWMGARSNGLVAGQVIGLAVGLAAAGHLLSPPRPSVTVRPTAAQKQYLRKHRAFWCIALPADLLGALVAQLPLLLISSKHGIAAAGLFGLTQRMMAAPVSLFAASVLEVFKLQSVREFQIHGNCSSAYAYTFKVLVLLGVSPALLMCAFAPDLFSWVFGEVWRGAGEFAQIIAPLYFLNFVASPLSYVFYVVGKQKVELFWQISKCAMTLTVFLAPLTLKQSVLAYTIGYSCLYCVYLYASYRYAQVRPILVLQNE